MKKSELVNIIRKELKNIRLSENRGSEGTCSSKDIAIIKNKMKQQSGPMKEAIIYKGGDCCYCDGRFMPCYMCDKIKKDPFDSMNEQQRGGNNLPKLDPNLSNFQYLETTIKRMKSDQEFIGWYNGIFMVYINAGVKIPTGQETLSQIEKELRMKGQIREGNQKLLVEIWELILGIISGIAATVYWIFKALEQVNSWCCEGGHDCCKGGDDDGMVGFGNTGKTPDAQMGMGENRKYWNNHKILR